MTDALKVEPVSRPPAADLRWNDRDMFANAVADVRIGQITLTAVQTAEAAAAEVTSLSEHQAIKPGGIDKRDVDLNMADDHLDVSWAGGPSLDDARRLEWIERSDSDRILDPLRGRDTSQDADPIRSLPDSPRADPMDPSSLLRAIRQAFPPTDERFERLSDLARAVRGANITGGADMKDWRLADPDLIARNDDLAGLLGLMDGATFRHYLPLWLTVAATRGADQRALVSALITTLDPEMTTVADRAERFAERTRGLTEAQKAAIADVLASFVALPWIMADDRIRTQARGLASRWRRSAL